MISIKKQKFLVNDIKINTNILNYLELCKENTDLKNTNIKLKDNNLEIKNKVSTKIKKLTLIIHNIDKKLKDKKDLKKIEEDLSKYNKQDLEKNKKMENLNNIIQQKTIKENIIKKELDILENKFKNLDQNLRSFYNKKIYSLSENIIFLKKKINYLIKENDKLNDNVCENIINNIDKKLKDKKDLQKIEEYNKQDLEKNKKMENLNNIIQQKTIKENIIKKELELYNKKIYSLSDNIIFLKKKVNYLVKENDKLNDNVCENNNIIKKSKWSKCIFETLEAKLKIIEKKEINLVKENEKLNNNVCVKDNIIQRLKKKLYNSENILKTVETKLTNFEKKQINLVKENEKLNNNICVKNNTIKKIKIEVCNLENILKKIETKLKKKDNLKIINKSYLSKSNLEYFNNVEINYKEEDDDLSTCSDSEDDNNIILDFNNIEYDLLESNEITHFKITKRGITWKKIHKELKELFEMFKINKLVLYNLKKKKDKSNPTSFFNLFSLF